MEEPKFVQISEDETKEVKELTFDEVIDDLKTIYDKFKKSEKYKKYYLIDCIVTATRKSDYKQFNKSFGLDYKEAIEYSDKLKETNNFESVNVRIFNAVNIVNKLPEDVKEYHGMLIRERLIWKDEVE